MKFFEWILFCFLFVSCVQPLEPQFTDANKSVQDRVISLKELQKAECRIQTGDSIEENAFKSSAQKFTVEEATLFKSDQMINKFPFVEYQVEGSPICHILLSQQQIELAARPHFSYPVHFQVIGSYIRIFIEGESNHLPYQNLTSSLKSDRLMVPIGGYNIEQGEVRRMRNVVDEETHILNFYPSENQPFEQVDVSGTSQWIRKNVSHVLVSNLNEGLKRFKYMDKTDVFPKSYFNGSWYVGASVTSIESLHSDFGFSGYNISGDSYSGFTSGQKIYFEFESGYLRAFNENIETKRSKNK